MTLTDNGAALVTATVQADGTFSVSVTLPNQGANSIVATVTDSLGNVGTSAAVVDTLDSVAPTVTITSAAEASNVAAQTITGTVASGGAAAVVGQTVTLKDNGTTLATAMGAGTLMASLPYFQLSLWAAALVGLAVGLATMAGDLWESALKRRFGVKDSGDIIPGHGGLLDRVDGLMFAVVVMAAARLANHLGWGH